MCRIKYRSPWVAVLWSVCIPGFGQFYNRDFLVGIALLFLEFLINTQANLNLAIYHSFKGSFPQVYQVTNIQWVLFYPCVYAFASWQAYNKAIEINNSLNSDLYKESNEPNRRTRLNGFFAGFALGGTLGVIYNGSIGYVFSGILGGFLGAVIGSVIEGLIIKRHMQHI